MNLQPQKDISKMTAEQVFAFFREFPSVANIGSEVVDYSDNFDRVTIKIPFNEQTKNFMGITYGGTMYSATDGMYVTMLWYRLGSRYIAVDKRSVVENIRPGTSDLTAEFRLSDEEVTLIKTTLENEKSMTRDFVVELFDEKNKLVCRITKTIYIRKNPQT